MTDNAFLRSPVQNALARERAAMAERAARRDSTMGLAPVPAPATSLPGAASATTPPATDPRAVIEAASTRYNVPANLIMALGETAGLSPEDAPKAADAIAAALAAPLGSGRKHSEALRALFPDAPEGFEQAVVARSNAIYAELYAPKPAEDAPAEGPGRGIVETIIDPFGTSKEMVKGLGRGIAGSVSAGARALGYEETALAAGEIAQDERLAPGVKSYKDIGGVGDAARYAAGLGAESAPEMAAVVGAALGGTAVAGPAGGIGAGMAASTLFNAGRNIQRQESELPDQAPSVTRAVVAGLGQAGLDVIVPGRIVGALGTRLVGALSERGLLKAAKEIGGDTLIESVTEGAQQLIEIGQANPDLLRVIVSPNEGEMEKSDQLLGELVESMVGGGVVGGTFSGAGALLRSGQPTADAPEAEADLPLAIPAPTSGGAIIPEPPARGESLGPVGAEAGAAGGGGDRSAPTSPAPAPLPAGPLESALRAGPGAIAPDLRPGDKITIEPEGIGPIGGVFVSESAAGVRVRSDDGEDFEIPRDEIEAGFTRLQPHGAAGTAARAPAVEPEASPVAGLADLASRLATWKPPAADAPAPITNLAAAQERLAYIDSQAKGSGWTTRLSQERAKAQAAIAELEGAAVPAESVEAAHSDPIPPAAPPATAPDAIRMKNGKPFATIGQARQAVRKRGLEPDDFSYPREGKGLVAVPKGGAAPSQNTRARAAERAPEKRTVIAPLDKDGAPTGPKVIINRLSREEMEAELDAKAAPKAEEEPEVVAASPAEPAIPAPPVEAIPGRPAVAAATPAASGAPAVRQIREKAGKLSGVDQATADRLSADLGIKLSPDSTGGYTFSWKHAGRLRAAIEQPAEKATDGSGQGAAGKEKPPVAAQRREKPAKQPPAAIVTQLNDDFGNWYVPGGAILKSATGRSLSPAPTFTTEDNRRTKLSIGRQREWLLQEAKAEAEARGDRHMARQFEGLSPRNFSRSDADMVNEYLFGDSWPAGDPVSTPAEIAVMDAAIDEMIAARKPTDVEEERTVPAGHTLGSVKKLTKAEAKARASYPEVGDVALTAGDFQAIVSRHAPYAVFSGYGPTRAAAINAAIARAERNAPKPAATSTPAEIKAEAKAVDTTPTDGQKEAGNYAMGHIKVHGHDVTIETPKGATRRGKAPDGTEWSVKMPADYGYIRRTEGADGDHVDVYVGENPGHPRAFVVDQFDPETDRFDEHKVVLGAITEAQATAIYDAGFSDGSGPRRRKAVSEYSVEGFSLWLRNGDQTKPAAWRSLERDAAITKSIVGAERQEKSAAAVRDAAAIREGALPVEDDRERQRRENAAKLDAIKADTPPDGWGAGNKLVTGARAAELRERPKAKLRDQLNAGIDPEIIAIGTELPYLRSWYNGARDLMEDSGHSVDGMDDASAVRAGLATIEEASKIAAGRDSIEKAAESPSKEAPDGLQGPVSDGDARKSAEDVQRTPSPRKDGRAPSGEGARSQEDVRGSDRERAEAAERPAGDSVSAAGGESGARNADRVPARVEQPPLVAPAALDHRIAPGALDEGRSWKAKAADNITAIKLVRAIEADGRPATAQEQEALARYVGWGGLAPVFPDQDGAFGKGYEKIGAELRELLTDAEYATARRTTQYAHYTAEVVVRAMWEAAERLGFKGGSVFEPGMGVGNFAGMMPASLAGKTAYAGLELDPTSARIARLLYPRSGVRQDDFTKAPLPRDAFDLVIGNPPFADIPIKSDPAYPQGFLLHDYFFAKSLDAVRPGGLLMFITSAGTLNKIDDKARTYLSARAEFVGAVRLPGDAFEKNAGTAVTTDIIVLRKFMPGERAALPDGLSPLMGTTTVSLPDKNGGKREGAVSSYFVEHPDMVLGEEGFFDRLYAGRYGVRSRPGSNLAGDLPVALAKLGENVMRDAETPQARAEIDVASAERKDGSFYLKNDVLMQQRDGVGVPVERRGTGVAGRPARDIEIIRGLVPVRDALRAVYAADLAGDAANAESARRRLNRAYDTFTQRHGPINKAEFSYRRPTSIQAESARAEAREEARYAGDAWDEGSFDIEALATADGDGRVIYPGVRAMANARKAAREAALAAGEPWREGSFDPDEMPDVVVDKRPNIEPFADDPEHYRLRAIEHYDDATGEARKSDVFVRNVVSREVEPEIRGVGDAVLYVLNRRGRFDLAEVARVAAMPEAQAREDLGGRVFENPAAAGDWLLSEEYLSGNVRQKLREARAAAERDARYQRNADALEAVQPPDLAPAQIAATLGMPWIPTETVSEFATARLGLSRFSAAYTPRLAYWQVSGDEDSAAATSDWGTSRVSAVKLLDAILNKSEIKVVDRQRNSDGSYTTVTNKEQTEAALAKAKEIREAFEGWIYQDEARADRLAALYNETYNNLVVRAYDGSYLKTPGVSTAWSWRPHQTRVIARIIQSGNTYMAHAVGSGKTSAMIGAGMEMRRLGLARKPMYAVPNHMLAQFTKEFYEQYPTARIAVADERQFHTDRRKQFVADVAAGDLDAVIITHSAFGMIPVSDEFQASLIQREIDEYREILGEFGKDQETRITRKRIEKQIERLEQRLAGRAAGRRDQVFTFEEMGVDFLFVDEAHLFRKLDFATKMGNLKGIDPTGSDMAWNLYAKVQYLESIKPGRNLVLASGTPVTNTMAELFTLSRYIQPQELEDRGLQQFDAWASAFGESVPAPEQDAAGNYKMITRFARFVNIPQLSAIVRQNVDVVTSRDLDQYVTRPKIKGGRRTMNLAERSEDFADYQSRLAARIKAIEERKGPPKAGDDIILAVINDGRKANIDMRMVDPVLYRPDPSAPSKLDMMVDNLFEIWQRSKKQPFYRPEAGGYSAEPVMRGPATQLAFVNLGLTGAFQVPAYIRSELVRRGVPRGEIAFISDFKTHVAKQRLFNDVNEGKIRILIGSGPKMGVGTNVQRRLLATHNLDPLWYPADDEQRNGRALRQGNMNPEIEIHDYGLKGSYDSTMWQMMERKGRFIESFWNGDGAVRDMDDLGEAAFYEQAKALSTADPRVVQLTEMRQDLEKLQRLSAAFAQEQYALRRRVADARRDATYAAAAIERWKGAIARRVETTGDAFRAAIGGTEFDKRAEAGSALLAAIKARANQETRGEEIGSLGGFPIAMDVRKVAGGWDWRVDLRIDDDYGIGVSVSPSEVGTIRSAEAILGSFEDRLARSEKMKAEAERDAVDYAKRQDGTFKDAAALDRLGAEVRALTKAIYEPPPAPSSDSTEASDAEPQFSVAAPEGGPAFADAAALRAHLAAEPPRMVERLIAAGRIVLHDTIASLPGGPHPAGAQGMTTPDGVVHLVASNLTPATAMPVLMHEAFHSGAEALVGDKAWRGLMVRLGVALKGAEERRRTGRRGDSDASFWDGALRRIDAAGVAEGHRAEELAAYAIEERAKAPAGIREVVDRILGAVKAFVLRRFGRQLGAVTPAELRSLAMAALRSGKVTLGAELRFSVAPPPGSFTAPGIPAATDAQIEAAERGLIGNALTRAMAGDGDGGKNILGLVPGRPLFTELAKKMPAAQEYLGLKLDMDALRNQWHARMDTTAQAWRKLIWQDGAANARLMDIMHEATLLGADPSGATYESILNEKDREALNGPRRGRAWEIAAERARQDEERRVAYGRLRKRFLALPEAFQRMFRTVRDEYKALNDAFEKTLLENIDRAMAVGLRAAERAHEVEIERIRDEGLTGKERTDAVAAADKRLAAAKWRHGANKRARMADLRVRFETQKVPAPYFPLARFGNFFVAARDKETGKVVHFSRHERPGAGALDAAKKRVGWGVGRSQQEVAREMRAKGYAVEVGVIGETDTRQMVDPAFVTDVEAILDTASVPEAVMDAVWQRWLETLPDLSIRKSRIHRKGTPGYDSDAFRAFGHHMFHGSHQLARLRYAMLMEESLQLAGTQAKNQDDPVRAGLVFEEMRRRHAYTMNPKGAWWSQIATSAAFVYYLAMSPAAAIVNVTQTTILGTPILGAAFEKAGVSGAASALGKALTDFTRGRGHAMESSRLSADEKAAMQEAYDRGAVDKSQAHDLAGVGETGVEYSAARTKVMGVISWFFHHAERMNREITFLAAYRMGRDAGLEHHAAIEKAADLTWKTHFDYQGSARPRFMQGDAARVALVFRNYSVNMLWRLVRDVHQSINAKDPAERREAIHQLAGITGMLFLHAGVRGVWGYGLAMTIIGLFFAGGSDDAEDELTKAVVGVLGTQIGGMVLNGAPGHLTRTNLTGRIGMPDLWFRAPDRQLEGEDEYHYWLSEMLGAAVGMAETGFRGVSMIRDGEVYRGVETLMPKALRDVMRSGRYLANGVETMKGDPVIADPGVVAIITQALGFTPAAVAERYAANTKDYNRQERIEGERSDILTDAARALRGGKPIPEGVRRRLQTFNAAHPGYAITADTIRDSVKARARASARMVSGFTMNPKIAGEIEESRAPLVYQ